MIGMVHMAAAILSITGDNTGTRPISLAVSIAYPKAPKQNTAAAVTLSASIMAMAFRVFFQSVPSELAGGWFAAAAGGLAACELCGGAGAGCVVL